MQKIVMPYFLYISAKNITYVVKYYCISLVFITLFTRHTTPTVSLICATLFLLHSILNVYSTFRRDSYPGLQDTRDIDAVHKEHLSVLSFMSLMLKSFVLYMMIIMPVIQATVIPEKSYYKIESMIGGPTLTSMFMALPQPMTMNAYLLSYEPEEEEESILTQIELSKSLASRSEVSLYMFTIFFNITICSGVEFLMERRKVYAQMKIEEEANGAINKISPK